jgi:hypothetical protein
MGLLPDLFHESHQILENSPQKKKKNPKTFDCQNIIESEPLNMPFWSFSKFQKPKGSLISKILEQKLNKNISPMQKYKSSSKKFSKRNQNPSKYYYNSIITNLKFQHKPRHHL